jgi:hypothetical protein
LTIALGGKLLEQNIEERAGLYDLLHEADVRLDGNKIVISVAFDKVAEMERKSLDRSFPRKARPNGTLVVGDLKIIRTLVGVGNKVYEVSSPRKALRGAWWTCASAYR